MSEKLDNQVVTGEQAKTMRESTLGTVDFSSFGKEAEHDKEKALSSIFKQSITRGMLNLYNTKIRPKSKPVVSQVNHKVYLDICDKLNVSDEIRNQYSNRDANFGSQTDDLILAWKKVSDLAGGDGELPQEDKKNTIAEEIQKLRFVLWDEHIDAIPSQIGAGMCAILGEVNLRQLALHPTRDKLSGMNETQVNFFYTLLSKKE